MTEYSNIAYAYCSFDQYFEGITQVLRIFGIDVTEVGGANATQNSTNQNQPDLPDLDVESAHPLVFQTENSTSNETISEEISEEE